MAHNARTSAATAVTLVVALALTAPASGSAALTETRAGSTTVTAEVAATTDIATVRPAAVRLDATRVVGGLDQPIGVASAHDGSGRLFVVEEGGRVRVVRKGVLQPGAYLDIRDRVLMSNFGQGLLGIAFHPQFTKKPFLFVAYTRHGALQISRFRATSSAGTHISESREVRVISVPYRDSSEHNGSQLTFDAAGLLYITTGDGGGASDPDDAARDLTSLRGKVLRINVDRHCGTRQFCVPRSNPLVATTRGRGVIFDWGLRNPWRMSIDHLDGTLWIGDVGQAAWEEIDHVRPIGGRDFGWSCKEGLVTFRLGRCAHRTMTRPLRVYSHDNGRCAVIGGYVYRGTRSRFARGLYVYGDFCTGSMWAIGRTSDGSYPRARVGDVGQLLNSFGEDGSRELYAVDHAGWLYRLVFHRR